MFSLIRLAALAGVLCISVQGAVVRNRRQLEGPGPIVHPSACTDLTTVASSTDSHPLPTNGTGEPIGSRTIGSPRIVHPTKRAKLFSLPLFTPIPIDTASVEGPGVGGSCATVEANSTSDAGSAFTPGASAVPVQLNKPIFTEPIPSHEVTLEGASVTHTATPSPVAYTQAVGLRV
ncbi:hypothetical protein IW261DRAFT_1611355 [Armillaria novae-zelandiae]|uniref:Uncharacterized protein n=1 Tax=Armillaria novae-zelandiae TaxID=153914 RepID=A0AA39NW41_9AGAR|nr:hypothetical protein IW261DRAFT_1611355 [Armillaria novae-zelandiae]